MLLLTVLVRKWAISPGEQMMATVMSLLVSHGGDVLPSSPLSRSTWDLLTEYNVPEFWGSVHLVGHLAPVFMAYLCLEIGASSWSSLSSLGRLLCSLHWERR